MVLCAVGSKRRTPACGTYASSVRERVVKVVRRVLNDEQKQQIIEYCMRSSNEKNVYNATACLGVETILVLEKLVPVFISRSKKLKDFLNE